MEHTQIVDDIQNTENSAPAPVPVSRQVRRARERQAEKEIRKHMNEVVLKKNRQRR